ncbi:branched-chain amino acid ABC transporter ATP-binding protein/permease [Castellaniella sp. GW247-6E4]|uniref:branched-chain amino acid ABC transporter ATP-binding protein/permease n=1 Tax=Castellaniella sp. GW247-6E4 TaxID=3140380 RepID=UPI003315102E
MGSADPRHDRQQGAAAKQGRMPLVYGLVALLVIAVLAMMPYFASPYMVSFVFTVLIAYTLAQSWDWVAGEMGYINLGHYCFYGVGAYAFSLVLASHTTPVLALIWAVLFTGAVAAILAFPLFRLRGDYFAFATLALLPLAEILAYNLSSITHGADGVMLPAHDVRVLTFVLAVALSALAFLASVLLDRSRFAYTLRGIRNDELVLETMGGRIQSAKTKILILSSGFAALAGALQAWQLSYIDPPTVFGLDVALIPIAMALLGGSGLLWGPLVGVLVLAVIQQWLLINLTMLNATVYGAIILFIGRYMPGGILRAGWLRKVGTAYRRRARGPAAAAEKPGEVHDATAAITSLPLTPAVVDRQTVVLDCQKMSKAFGGNVAVDALDLRVHQGEIVGLIGGNGSGKTTLFNCISKVFEPTSGGIFLFGENIQSLRRDQIARIGVGRTYQIPRPFGDLTVDENVAIPLMYQDQRLRPPAALAQARQFLDYVGLSARIGELAEGLSLQEKKALELARALACRPKLLLIDEVASGLTPAEVARFTQHIRDMRDELGMTVIWIEHIFSALEQVVDRVVVLDHGRLIADGPLAEIVRDERVVKAYLGSAHAEDGHAGA